MDGRVLQLPHVRVPATTSPAPRVLAATAIAVAAVGAAFLVARETPLFSLQRIEVRGAPAPVAAQVRETLAPLRGSSLVGLDGAALLRRVESLPTVLSARYDRAFPHSLRLVVVTEKPVAVLRVGRRAWLVSARGRVEAPVEPRSAQRLPRIWLPRGSEPDPGTMLTDDVGGLQARALGAILATGFVPRIAAASAHDGALVFTLRNGVEVRVGRPSQLRLKLTIARRVLPTLPSGSYLDVGVPERVVGAAKPQVAGRG